MEAIVLNRSQARKIIIHAAGLSKKASFGTGIDAVYRVIDHLGYVQLDTNYVVERAHHHAMFARVPDYQTEWLAALCNDGDVFEYFTSDAGFLPMHDFRFSLPVKKAFATQGSPLTKAQSDLMTQILDQVERDGAVMVGDFENDRIEASSSWWDWRQRCWKNWSAWPSASTSTSGWKPPSTRPGPWAARRCSRAC